MKILGNAEYDSLVLRDSFHLVTPLASNLDGSLQGPVSVELQNGALVAHLRKLNVWAMAMVVYGRFGRVDFKRPCERDKEFD